MFDAFSAGALSFEKLVLYYLNQIKLYSHNESESKGS